MVLHAWSNACILVVVLLKNTHPWEVEMHQSFTAMQAQRARSVLAVQVLGSMKAAGIDAFVANTTTELAMSNLVGLPTVSVPIGFNRIDGAQNSSRRRNPVTVGFFGWPNGEPEVSFSHAM